ncbi:MAG: hypothetical protein K1X75_04320 [Leptospirales bacterium]|nr:hypothetical protein [Leptospirales bacterium]
MILMRLTAALVAIATCFLALRSAQARGESGDGYYSRRDFALAQAAYMLEENGASASELESLRLKQALAAMQRERFREALTLLDRYDDFSQLYLRMYASMRLGWTRQALTERDRIGALPDLPAASREQTALLESAIFLELNADEEARQRLLELQSHAQNQEVQRRSGEALDALERHQQAPRKSPLLASVLSAFLPGAGYVYSDQWADGASSFLFTAATVGPALLLYDLERAASRPHSGSLVFGILGLIFYLASVLGSANAARRFNNFQTRQFHDQVRDAFFNLDYAAEASGVVFAVDLQ